MGLFYIIITEKLCFHHAIKIQCLSTFNTLTRTQTHSLLDVWYSWIVLALNNYRQDANEVENLTVLKLKIKIK
jgi:hypothetical protein